jgi:hypothetical protein
MEVWQRGKRVGGGVWQRGAMRLVLKFWPVVNGLAHDPNDLARHEDDPARQGTGPGRPEARTELCLGLVGSPLGGHGMTRLARPDQAWW